MMRLNKNKCLLWMTFAALSAQVPLALAGGEVLESSQSSNGVRDQLIHQIFGSEGVQPVKAASLYLLSRNPKDGEVYILMGKLKKDHPASPETHAFHGTFSTFSGKPKPQSGDRDVLDIALRRFTEETGEVFGKQSEALGTLIHDRTLALRNMNWTGYPVAIFVTSTDFSDQVIHDFRVTPEGRGEMQELAWIHLNDIWTAVDQASAETDHLTWREYNSQANLRARYHPLNAKFQGVELEVEKNKLKRHLSVKNHLGSTIQIADYVVRTLLENEQKIKEFSGNL